VEVTSILEKVTLDKETIDHIDSEYSSNPVSPTIVNEKEGTFSVPSFSWIQLLNLS